MALNIRQKKEKRLQIIKAAAKVFAQKGYSATVVADIAQTAGIGKGTVYGYFKSKEDIFFGVFEWLMQKTGTTAQVKVSELGGSAAQRLSAVSNSMVDMWDELKDIFTLVMEFWAASAAPKLRRRFKDAFRRGYREFRGIVSAIITDGVNRGEFCETVNAEAMAASLVGTWDALFLQAWFDPEFDIKTVASESITIMLRGMQRAPVSNEDIL